MMNHSTMNVHTREFCALLKELLELSYFTGEADSLEGRPFNAALILNPEAGGFKIKSRANLHKKILKAALLERGKLNLLKRKINFDVFITRSPELENFIASGMGETNLFIIAGGDGAHRDTLDIIIRKIFDGTLTLKPNFAVVRLPLGTGNDGADRADFGEALELLTQKTRICRVPALKLTTATAGKGPFYAFNVLSVGLDAFVTHMVNKMKGTLPGDSYKLWVDIASLFYDRIYKVDMMNVRLTGADGALVKEFCKKVLLLAVGASGGRTYGSQKHILPDERNVCMVHQMPLLRKVALKDKFTDGTHINMPECELWTAASVEFSVRRPVLAQMDGETTLILPSDCPPEHPASISLTAPVIPILRPV